MKNISRTFLEIHGGFKREGERERESVCQMRAEHRTASNCLGGETYKMVAKNLGGYIGGTEQRVCS